MIGVLTMNIINELAIDHLTLLIVVSIHYISARICFLDLGKKLQNKCQHSNFNVDHRSSIIQKLIKILLCARLSVYLKCL